MQAPISSLAVALCSVTTVESATCCHVGAGLSASVLTAAVANQSGLLVGTARPSYQDTATRPGDPATMSGNTLPGPPPAATVVGADQWSRSPASACTTRI